MKLSSLVVGLAALVALPSSGLAKPLHNTCVGTNNPPPWLSGPPTWTSGWGTTAQVEPSLEDPRWATATATSFQAVAGTAAASATAPMHTRMVYGSDGYLYASYISDLSPNNTQIPRDAFVGFLLPADQTIGGQPTQSVIFQFHVGAPQLPLETVDVTANTIALRGHGLVTGDGPVQLTNTGTDTLPAPLAKATDYWIVAVDANTVKLATSYANAMAATVIDLTSAGTGTTNVVNAPSLRAHALPFCSKFDATSTGNCTAAGNAARSWWTAYRDDDTDAGTRTGQCSTTVTGHKWKLWAGASGGPPVSWLGNNGEAAMWEFGPARSAATDPFHISPLDANRWAVQVRFKIDLPSNTVHGIVDGGIDPSSRYWFEATESDSNIFTSIARWPTELGASLCVVPTATPFLIHPLLGPPDAPTPTGGCKDCSLDHYSLLTLPSTPGTPDPGCDKGLRIDSGHIGTVNDPGVTNYDAVTLTHRVVAYAKAPPSTDPAPGKNAMVAQIFNDGPSVTNLPLRARFRLADWGTSVGQDATWSDVPRQPTTPFSTTVGTSKQTAVAFDWQLSNDEICAYKAYDTTTTPRGGVTCVACTCDGTIDNCAAGSPGITSKLNNVVGKCYRQHSSHQCMYVELSAPNGGATFTQSSAFNNWDFGENSVFSQAATIDTSKVPQQANGDQQILLVLMPRNMPAKLPAQTGVAFVHDQLVAASRALTRVDGEYTRQPKVVEERAKHWKRKPIDVATVKKSRIADYLGDDTAVELERARVGLPPDDYVLAGKLMEAAATAHEAATHPIGPAKGEALALNHYVVGALGPEIAAKVVPTLEIYPYYAPEGAAANTSPKAPRKVWQPMPAFSVFLSHDGGTKGYTDIGLVETPTVKKLQANVYLLTVHRAHKQPVQVTVRATATEAKEARPILRHPVGHDVDPEPPHDPEPHPHDPHDPHVPHPTPVRPMPRPDMR